MDIAQSPKAYQKYNSFVGIRHAVANIQDVLSRVREVRSSLDQHDLSQYQQEVVLKACDEILGQETSAPEPRFTLHDYVAQEILSQEPRHLPRYLFYRYRYEMYPKRKVLDDFPPSLQVEVSSICNYRCVFCYQTDQKLTDPQNGHMGLMSLDLFKKVIDQAQGHCENVTLASRGEPLMNRNFKEMLAYTRDKFVAFKINTNAWFLDAEKSHAILEAGVDTLVFSVDAATEPLYSQLRVNGNLERVLKNIDGFQEIRAKPYPNSRIITRASGVKVSDDQQLDEMENLWGAMVDQVAFVAYNPWENTYQQPINDISDPCSDLWRRTFVWFDGTVNPCDVDYRSTLAVGNVKEADLESIWNGQGYSALRESHLAKARSGLFPCNRCTLV